MGDIIDFNALLKSKKEMELTNSLAQYEGGYYFFVGHIKIDCGSGLIRKLAEVLLENKESVVTFLQKQQSVTSQYIARNMSDYFRKSGILVPEEMTVEELYNYLQNYEVTSKVSETDRLKLTDSLQMLKTVSEGLGRGFAEMRDSVSRLSEVVDIFEMFNVEDDEDESVGQVNMLLSTSMALLSPEAIKYLTDSNFFGVDKETGDLEELKLLCSDMIKLVDSSVTLLDLKN